MPADIIDVDLPAVAGFTLRPYQREHTDRLLAIIRGRRVAHDGSDTGTGKSYCAAFVAGSLAVETLVICPLSVVPVWRPVLAAAGVAATVMNYELAWRRLGQKVKCGRGFFFTFAKAYPLVIYDECFPADVLVCTGRGDITISSVHPGDMVATPAGPRHVLRTIHRHGLFELVKVTHENGSFECTPSHKVATARGWVRAVHLQAMQDSVFFEEKSAASLLFNNVHEQLSAEGAAMRGCDEGRYVESGVAVKESGFTSHEESQSHGQSVGPEKSVSSPSGYWPQTDKTRRERFGDACRAGVAALNSWPWLDSRILHRASAFVDLVENSFFRSGQSLPEISRGMRWGGPPRTRKESDRQQKGFHRWSSWLDVDALSQHGHPQHHFGGCFSNPLRVLKVEKTRSVTSVFDLEVQDEHVYFANRVLVSNCHRTGGETTINSKLLIASKRAGSHILTLSATAADSVLRFKALGFALGLHGLSNYREWLISHGAKEVPIYGRGGKPVMRKDGQPATKLDIGKRANTEAMQRLHEQIFGSGQRGSRMRIADIPDFPPTQIEVRLLDGMNKELERLSDELQTYIAQRNALGQFSDEILAKLVFWRQAAETAKIPHFIDMAEDALETSKVAIFVNFNRTVDELVVECAKRKWKCGVIRGDQSPSERQTAIEAFQRNELDVIVCNIQAGGVGVSLHDPLTKYPRTALFSPCWSAKDLKQGFGRVHRDGGGVSRQFLLYWSTGIEARVAGCVRRKLDNLAMLNDSELDGSFTEVGLPL